MEGLAVDSDKAGCPSWPSNLTFPEFPNPIEVGQLAPMSQIWLKACFLILSFFFFLKIEFHSDTQAGV